MKVVTPDEIQQMLQGPPPSKDLRVEIRVLERERFRPDAPWSPFREQRRIEIMDAGIKIEFTTTNKGESVTVHAAGMNDDPMSKPPVGLPS